MTIMDLIKTCKEHKDNSRSIRLPRTRGGGDDDDCRLSRRNSTFLLWKEKNSFLRGFSDPSSCKHLKRMLNLYNHSNTIKYTQFYI